MPTKTPPTEPAMIRASGGRVEGVFVPLLGVDEEVVHTQGSSQCPPIEVQFLKQLALPQFLLSSHPLLQMHPLSLLDFGSK
jgi:hypothetical protein